MKECLFLHSSSGYPASPDKGILGRAHRIQVFHKVDTGRVPVVKRNPVFGLIPIRRLFYRFR